MSAPSFQKVVPNKIIEIISSKNVHKIKNTMIAAGNINPINIIVLNTANGLSMPGWFKKYR
jgi:hypothetical protein